MDKLFGQPEGIVDGQQISVDQQLDALRALGRRRGDEVG
jgi:hypothetical protein